jgi:ferric-dicitrate binding protein FerR (iron transport regulator)
MSLGSTAVPSLEVLLRLLDGRLPPLESAVLIERLRADAQLRRRLSALLLQMGELGELRAERRQAGLRSLGLVPRPEPRRRRTVLAVAAAGVALAAAVLLWVGTFRGRAPAGADRGGARATLAGPALPAARHHAPLAGLPPPALEAAPVGRLSGATGVVHEVLYDRRRPALAGDFLRRAGGVETGPAARATLTLDDGSRLELGAETLVESIEGGDPVAGGARARVALEHGELTATVEPRAGAGPATVLVPLAQIDVEAGRLRLAAGPQEARLTVESGRALVRRLSDEQRIAVEAHQAALITEGGALVARTPAAALLVRGGAPEREGEIDRLTAQRLAGLGLEVAEVLDQRLGPEDLEGKAVVVVSSSCEGAVLRDRLASLGLREAPVPIVACENSAFDVLGLTGPRLGFNHGRGTTVQSHMQIYVEPGHPLSAGLEGQVRIATAPVSLSWGDPGPGAVKVARRTPKPGVQAVLFGYDRGAPMVGLTAPARRVACFLTQHGAEALAEPAWRLFDASVKWAAGL